MAWLLLVVPLGVARAQDAAGVGDPSAPEANDEVAKGLFQAGAAAFDAGQFEEALRHFQAAYARSPRPKLLFNIGQAADRLRQDDIALDAFRRYLAEFPEAQGREQIEARVRVLEQAVAEREAAASEAAEQAPQPTPTEGEPAPKDSAPVEPASGADSGGSFPWAPVTVLGVGVVAMVAGAAFGMTAKSEEDDYALLKVADAMDAREANALLDDAEGHATLSNMLLGAGAALTAVSAVWLVLVLSDDGGADEGHEAAVSAAPRFAPGELGLVLRARYGGGP
jgi:tetratricopeptide (TPR) repeat protein